MNYAALFLLSLLCCAYSSSVYPNNMVNLEEMQESFVLETRKIEIEGHPYAFNPSIVRWKEKIFLSFRTYDGHDRVIQDIWLLQLDPELRPIGKPILLQFEKGETGCLPRRQDPRLLCVGERLFVVYNNMIDNCFHLNPKLEIRRMFLAEVKRKKEKFVACNAECFFFFEGVNPRRSEKNWTPFVYRDKLLFSYSLFPHRILEPLLGEERCNTLYCVYSAIQWDWGVLRGGTPAVELDDCYLAFFHSCCNLATLHSKGEPMLHYFMGAYTFSKEPPFAIERISPKPIVASGFYEGKEYKTWRPLRVVFPGGVLVDKEFIWVVYGRQDHETWVVKFDKKALLESLIPCDS